MHGYYAIRALPDIKRIIILYGLPLLIAATGHGQLNRLLQKDVVDTSYIEVFDSMLNARAFVSQKLTNPTLIGADRNNPVRYLSNGPTNIGLGTTVGWLTLNIGVNFGFINHDNVEKGRTRFLDLHTQAMARPYCVDVYGQIYKGVYLLPQTGPLPRGDIYIQRPDIYTQLIGSSAYFFPNWRKFSYPAAVFQRDRQKRSAGSLIFGGEIFTAMIRGDSNLIPPDRASQFLQGPVTKATFFELGIGGGYAYSLILKKYFFIHASLIGSLSAGMLREHHGNMVQNTPYIKPNFLIRPSIGYNSKRWNASVMLFGSQVNSGKPAASYRITTTNLRYTLAYRIHPSEKFRKRYEKILRLNPFWLGEPAH